MDAPERVAAVTGGSRGIGLGIVEELARSGWSVVIHYRTSEAKAAEAADRARELGAPRAALVRADLAVPAEAELLVDRCAEAFGRIDVWVNNAGIAPPERRDLLETTQASWDLVLGTNLSAPFFLTQKVAARMIGQGPGERTVDPHIVFITSVSAEFASVNRGEYCVAKAGLSMVAQLFAARLAEHGIRVSEVRPGIIRTEMTAAVQADYDRRLEAGLAPIRRSGEPEDVGRAVAALAGGAFGYATGGIYWLDGGLHLRRL